MEKAHGSAIPYDTLMGATIKGGRGKMAKPASPTRQAIEQLRQATLQLHNASHEAANAVGRRDLEAAQAVVDELQHVVASLDPVRSPLSLFDPADPRVVGKFVGIALVAQDKFPLLDLPAFYGAGVYALYYEGDYAPYRPLAGSENPIYVGKADPEEPSAKTPRLQGPKLHRRLKEHLRSICRAAEDDARTLNPADFRCRFLVVQSGWQIAAENYLINLFQPIWNDEIRLCFGIGKHGDSPDTRGNLRSPWDTLHPGRKWAYRNKSDGSAIKDAKPKEVIFSEIADHFAKNPPYEDVEAILKRFFKDLHQGN